MLCDPPRADPVRLSLAHGQYLRILIRAARTVGSKNPGRRKRPGFAVVQRGDAVRRS